MTQEEQALKGAELHDIAIEISWLCESLVDLSNETICAGDFKDAIRLSGAFGCLSRIARHHAETLAELAP